MDYFVEKLSREFNIRPKQAEETIALIDDGNTIPFIARYRKEKTGNLDDIVLREFNTRLEYLRKLVKRKEEVTASIEEQGKMTAEIEKALAAAESLQDVEDIYQPYKKKKRTRGMIAREQGLEPLADMITEKQMSDDDIRAAAESFVDPEKEVETAEDALKGAMDIVAENLSDNAYYRKIIRSFLGRKSVMHTAVTKEFADKQTEFEDYYDYTEDLATIANHRILAINRGEKQKVLSVKIDDFADIITNLMIKDICRGRKHAFIELAVKDAYKRLIFPSIEREIRSNLKERAEESAIKMFGVNLKKLLLQRPFKGKVVMGFDPAFRTGCKIAVLDEMGTLLDTATVYPTAPHNDIEGSERVVLGLIDKYGIDLIAIGNGTASRESEQFIADTIKKASREVHYIIVNEAGASVYSASPLGAEEYPDINVSLRGAISIGGRLQDPLSELVKIDPKHIGVGQYQHDVNQKALEKALDETVEDAVNNVGVDINRASASLLSYVSGINKTMAKNIIAYREANGRFTNREEIKNVKGIGAKAFEQCAGFLRIDGGDNAFDRTGVHPESYAAAEGLLERLDIPVSDLEGSRLTKKDVSKLKHVDIPHMAEDLGIGEPTLKDIVMELQKPGRDPRDEAPAPILKSGVISLDDLKPGMVLAGTVRNVIDFGAFVDIGVHQDGLVHISQICDRYIKHPSEVLSVGDIVQVKVLDVDKKRQRISLTMKM